MRCNGTDLDGLKQKGEVMTTPDREALDRSIDDYTSSYASGDRSWFDHFSDGATIFPIGNVAPIVGRATYQENFGELLQEPRAVDVAARDVQITGDTAVVMQLLRVRQGQAVVFMRESSIWRPEDGTWKILHLDTSLATNPAPTEDLLDPDSIRVLNARLATASSQVGVAQ